MHAHKLALTRARNPYHMNVYLFLSHQNLTFAATFYALPEGSKLQPAGANRSLLVLAPRLWPFFRHTIASVRAAALRTFDKLLLGGGAHPSALLPVIPSAMQSLFRNFLAEEKEVRYLF